MRVSAFRSAFVFATVVLLVGTPLRAQPLGEAGRPYLHAFAPKAYGASAQNWALAQDTSGILYVGNNDGILTYDGVSWNLILTPTGSVVRSLAAGPDGTVYVGAQVDFGYLAPDSIGQLAYVSLLPHLPDDAPPFDDVWSTLATPHGVYFMAAGALFRWHEGALTAWTPTTAFHTAFAAHDQLFVRQWEVGLMRLADGSLELVPGGERFAEERVYVMLPFGDEVLVGTRTQGLFLYDGRTFTPFETEADAFLDATQLYHGSLLPDGTIALGTRRGGVAVIDRRGRLLRIVDEADGLPDQTVNATFVDEQYGLWLALNQGLARLDAPGPLTRFDDRDGLEGLVVAVARHDGVLYASTPEGTFRLRPATPEAPRARFEPVPALAYETFALLSTPQGLLAATRAGIFLLRESIAEPVTESLPAFALHRSAEDTTFVFAGTAAGLRRLRLDGGAWRDAGAVAGVPETRIRQIAAEPDGTLWLGVQPAGLLRARLPDGPGGPAAAEALGPEQGLPESYTPPFRVGDHVVLATASAILRRVPGDTLFASDPAFAPPVHQLSTFGRIIESPTGEVWIYANGRTVRTRPDTSGQYVIQPSLLGRIPPGSVFALYPDPADGGRTVWLGGDEGLVRFSQDTPALTPPPLEALVRQVVAQDSVLFAGRWAADTPKLRLPYALNALRLAYAAPHFVDDARTQYQVRLDPFDEQWSTASTKTEKEYTNLPEGDYVFRVRALDVYGRQSREGRYAFTIRPPWYRTWAAYGLYLLLAAGAVFGVDRVQRRRLIRRERERSERETQQLRADAAEAWANYLQADNERKEAELEKARALRKAYHDLDEAHRNLKATQDQLVQSEKLASLGQLTAGIAHEIKNPLNFVNNFAELNTELVDELAEELQAVFEAHPDVVSPSVQELCLDLLADLRSNAYKIAEHGKRADGIVRGMMQHASGSQSRHAPTHINTLVEEYANLAYHGMRAQQPGMDASIERDLDPSLGEAIVEPRELGRVLLNLFNNAFYAVLEQPAPTPDPGAPPAPRILVSTRRLGDHFEIRVQDDGPGIPEHIRQKIFEPFFTTKPTGKGTGLGLSLSYDIVTHGHGGSLSVESIPGAGATFVIRLPLREPAATA